MIAWSTFENAIHTWLRVATAIPAERILWARQNAARPDGDGAWISISRTDVSSGGRDWVTHRLRPAPVTAGQEITYVVNGTRTVTLSIQCYGGTATGDGSPEALLDRARLMLSLPSRRAAFQAANVGVGEIRGPRVLDGLRTPVVIEPRAILEMDCHLAAEVTETGTYIETVEVQRVAVDGTPIGPELVIEAP